MAREGKKETVQLGSSKFFFETLPMIGLLTAYSEAPLAPCYLLDNLNY